MLHQCSANLGATQCSALPPQLWAFWASSYKKQRWSWTPVARCPSWQWIWLTAPHSGWGRKGQHLCQDTQSSFTVHSTRFGYRQLHLQIRPPPLTSCTVLVLQPLGSVHVHVSHNLRVPKEGTPTSDFRFVLYQFPVGGGTVLDSRQKYVWVLNELEDWSNTSWTRTRCSVCNLYFPRKALLMFVWCFMVSIL